MNKRIIVTFVLLLTAAVSSAGIIVPLAAGGSTERQNNKTDSAEGTVVSQSAAEDYSYTEMLSSLPDNTEKISVKELPLEKLSPESKQDYYHKMLNAIDYYNTVSGSFKTNSLSKDGSETTVDYQVDMINNLSYERVFGASNQLETYVSPNGFVYVNNLTKTKHTSNITHTKAEELGFDPSALQTKGDVVKAQAALKEQFADEKRVTVNKDGENCYYHRMNSTNLCISASYSIFAEDMAFGYLSDLSLWEIVGDTTYLGRDAAIIKGKASDYGKKFNTAEFEMIVDKETGILLKHCGYDENGDLSEYIETTEISFDVPDVKTYDADLYSDYSESIS